MSDDGGLILEVDKETGIFVSTDSSSLGSFLTASGLQAFSARACPRRSRRVAVGLMVSGRGGEVFCEEATSDFEDPWRNLW